MNKNKKKVLVYFHTHWDREWYKTRVEFNFRLVKVFDDVLSKLKSDELPCFYFDGQVSALKDYLKARPENEKLVKKLIKEKKLYIGPFYCSTDSFLVSAQALLSNLDMGIKYSKELGCDEFIGYCADTFGHSKSLPAIFNYYNFAGGIFWRGLGDLPQCFDWQGSKSVYIRQGYFHDYLNCDLPYSKKAELIEVQLQKIDDGSQKILLLPLGADHLKAADNPKIQINKINKYLKNYELEISNPFEYLNKVMPNKKVNGELRNNSRNFILPGVLSSRVDIKQKNAYSQWALLRIAEPLNALCYSNNLIKENYQPQINLSKEELIKNHAHDSIYGCSVDDVHKDMLRRFDIADQTSKCVIEEIINELSKNTTNINIINLSDYEYCGLTEIKTDKKFDFGQLINTEFSIDEALSKDINKIPVTEDFKNIYTYLIKVNKAAPFSLSEFKAEKTKSDLKVSKTGLENSKIALKIVNGKIELKDKKTGKIYKNFIEFVDFADIGDSYNFAPLKNDKKIKAKVISSKILTKGDLRAELEINLKIEIPKSSSIKGRALKLNSHKLKMVITLDTQSDIIKFKINWINKSINHILKASFNLDEPIKETLSDDMLGTISRKCNPDYKMPVPALKGVELKTNTAPMQSWIEAQGVCVITKGLNEYETRKNSLEITLLRATDIISNPKNPARGTPAGPPIKTPDLCMLGENNAEFAIIFSDNTQKIDACKQSYYGCTFAFFGNNPPQKLLKIEYIFINSTYENALSLRVWDGENIKDM